MAAIPFAAHDLVERCGFPRAGAHASRRQRRHFTPVTFKIWTALRGFTGQWRSTGVAQAPRDPPSRDETRMRFLYEHT